MAGRLIILDLDRTIFDCDRFYLDICKQLLASHRITTAELAEVTTILGDPENNPYLDQLIERYHLDEQWVFQATAQLKPDAYLYPDVPDFFERMTDHTILIMTTGIPRFQELKFTISPRLAPYQYLIIEKFSKGDYLKARLQYDEDQLKLRGLRADQWFSELWLIDDRDYNFNALADVKHAKLFHIRRPTEKVKAPTHKPGVKVVTSLEEVQ